MDGILAHHEKDIVMFDVHRRFNPKELKYIKKTWKLFFSWAKGSRVFNITELEITTSNKVAFWHGRGHCAGVDTKRNKRDFCFSFNSRA